MAAENLNNLFKSHGAHPLKSFIPLLVNAPVFISFFIALRKMAELPVGSDPLPGSSSRPAKGGPATNTHLFSPWTFAPQVESMHTGGVLWFSDLTVSDPYYILPLTASATMLATLEVRPMRIKGPRGLPCRASHLVCSHLTMTYLLLCLSSYASSALRALNSKTTP